MRTAVSIRNHLLRRYFLAWAWLPSVLLSLLLPHETVRAGTVYSSGAPNYTGPGVDLGIAVGAELFTLSQPATLRAARFYAYGYLGSWDGSLDYYFFNRNGIYPAVAPFAGGPNPPFRMTILSQGRQELFRFDFDLIEPVALQPGSYWFGIRTDRLFDGGLAWDATTTPGAQYSAAAIKGNFNQWTLQGTQLAFELHDTPLVVPEPASSIVIALGACLRPPWRKILKRRFTKPVLKSLNTAG